MIQALGFTGARIYERLAKYGEDGIEALRAKAIPGRATLQDLPSKVLLSVYGDSNPVWTLKKLTEFPHQPQRPAVMVAGALP